MYVSCGHILLAHKKALKLRLPLCISGSGLHYVYVRYVSVHRNRVCNAICKKPVSVYADGKQSQCRQMVSMQWCACCRQWGLLPSAVHACWPSGGLYRNLSKQTRVFSVLYAHQVEGTYVQDGQVHRHMRPMGKGGAWQMHLYDMCMHPSPESLQTNRARRQSGFPTFISCQRQDANVLPKWRQSHQGDKLCDVSTVPLVARWPVFLARGSDVDSEPHSRCGGRSWALFNILLAGSVRRSWNTDVMQMA